MNYTLNLDLFDSLLQNYWDWQIALFLRFGFPMNFQGCCSEVKNDINSHKSAEMFDSHVDMYLQDECEYKAMYGPYKEPPFGECTHVFPFITREKQGSTKRYN